MRFLFRLLPTTLTVFFLAVAQDAGAQNPAVKIGYITDLSGKAAFWGTQSSFGAELAAEEFRTRGRDVQIVVGDSRLDTKTAITEAQQMVHFRKVDAVMNDFTPTSIAASAVVKRAKKLYVYLAPAVSILESNPYAFKSFLDYKDGCHTVARFWKSKGITKTANLKLNTEFGELCLEGSKKVFPDIVVVDYDSAQNLKTELLKLQNQGVQAIFQTAYEIDMLHRLRSMSELGYAVPVGGPEPLVTELVVREQASNLNNSTVFGYPPVSDAFLTKVKTKDPERTMTGIEAAALAYTHVRQIVAAISACPAEDIDCQVQEMEAQPEDSVIGFKGWKLRSANFDFTLRVWKDGRFIDSTAVGDLSN